MEITSEISRAESLAKLHKCISDIRSWIGSNLLKLNDNETDAFIPASPRYLHAVSDNVVDVGDASINIIKPVCQEPRGHV